MGKINEIKQNKMKWNKIKKLAYYRWIFNMFFNFFSRTNINFMSNRFSKLDEIIYKKIDRCVISGNIKEALEWSLNDSRKFTIVLVR